MTTRALSAREQRGWRRYWDGWVICPRHIALQRHDGRPWGVPANYDRPIRDDEECSVCRSDRFYGRELPPLPFILRIPGVH